MVAESHYFKEACVLGCNFSSVTRRRPKSALEGNKMLFVTLVTWHRFIDLYCKENLTKKQRTNTLLPG